MAEVERKDVKASPLSNTHQAVAPSVRASSSAGLINRMRSSFSSSHRPSLAASPSISSTSYKSGVSSFGRSNGHGISHSSSQASTYEGKELPTSRNGSIKRRRSLFRSKNGREYGDAPSIPVAPPQIWMDANLLGNEQVTEEKMPSEANTHTVTATFSTAASPRKQLDYHQNARLNVKQACQLLEQCAAEIKMRGLAVVGIFRPLRSAESTTELNRLIELFLLSSQPQLYQNVFLLQNTVKSTLFQDPLGKPDPGVEFRRKLSYANIHDVVALFKWALRRLSLRLSDVRSTQQYTWYERFIRQEKSEGYPKTAFSSLLLSSVEPETAKLFRIVFDIMATISAHHVSNAMSAHQISRTLGYWLFGRLGVDHEPVNFDGIYALWERAGQVAEHILLAFVREQASKVHLMPSRLTELLDGYPFLETDRLGPSLPHRFRSVKQTALLIETRTENLVVTPRQPRRSPKEVLDAALRSRNGDIESSEDLDDWMVMVATANGEESHDDMEIMDNLSGDETAVDIAADVARAQLSIQAEAALFSDEDVRVITIVDEELQRHRSIFEGRKETSSTSEDSQEGAEMLTSRDSSTSLHSVRSNDENSKRLIPPSRSSSIGPTSVKPLATLSETDEGAPFDWNAFSSSGFRGAAGKDAFQLDKAYRPKNELEKAFDEHDRSQATATRPRKSASRRRSKSYVPALLERRSPPRYILNSVSTLTFDESFASVWQDQLMDECPAARLPYLLCAQLNGRVANSLLGNAGKTFARGSNQWLIVHETIVAPRPPKPPMEKAASSSTFFRRNNHARNSSATLTQANAESTVDSARSPSFEDDRKSLFSIRSGFSTHFGRSVSGVRKMRSMLLPRKSAPAAANSYEASGADEKRQAEINAEVEELQAAVYADRARNKLQMPVPTTPNTAVIPSNPTATDVTDYSKT